MKTRLLAWLLSLSCILGMIPGGAAVEGLVAGDAAQSYEYTTKPVTATIGVGTPENGHGVQTKSYNSSPESFGSQLEGDPVAVQAYEELEAAFDHTTYTCGSYTVTVEYTSTYDRVVGTTPSYEATDAEIEDMMADFHCSVRNAFAAFCKDHPEVFYLGNTIEQKETLSSALSDGQYQWKVKTVTLVMESLFSSESRLETAKKRYSNALSNAVSYAQEGGSRYEQLKRVHDYLCDAVTYSSSATYAHSAYGALVDGSCVCEGYAMALKAICDELGIPCVEVSGMGITNESSESHMWNLVQMTNGKWYAVDTTWDDRSDATYHTFFLVGKKSTAKADFGLGAFSETHVESGYFYDDTSTKEFSYPKQNGSKYVAVTGVTVEEEAETDIRYTTALTAEVTPSNASIATLNWSSSDESIAVVDESGVVTGVSAGEVMITAASEDGPAASCRVTVSHVAVQSIALPEQTEVSCNRTVQLEAQITPEHATNRALTWTSTEETVATVDDNGLVTGVSEGTAEIIATAENGLTASTTVTVVYVSPTKVTLSESSADCYLGETVALTATVAPKNASNLSVTWSSSDEAIATVDGNGVVTGITEGTAVITATAEGNVSSSCTVAVRHIPVERVTLDQTELKLHVNDTQTLVAEVTPAKATYPEVTWKSSRPDTASVSVDGSVTAHQAGKATITATADGVSASCTVQVIPNLDQPELVRAVNAVKGVRITWNPVDGATGYMVCRKRSGSWAGTQLDSVSGQGATEYLDKTVKAGRTYYYTVYAMYGDEKASSFDLNGRSVYYIPTPELTSIRNVRAGLQIRWKKVDIADGYYVYRREESETSWTMLHDIKAGEALSYTDKAAKNRYTYQYTVRAYVDADRSAYHTAGLVLRRVTSPTLKSVRNSSRRAMMVRWSRVSYVTGYQVQYARSSDFEQTTTITISDKEKLNQKVTGLSKGRTYYVRVRAYKTQSGKKTYSAWSAKDRVKIVR